MHKDYAEVTSTAFVYKHCIGPEVTRNKINVLFGGTPDVLFVSSIEQLQSSTKNPWTWCVSEASEPEILVIMVLCADK